MSHGVQSHSALGRIVNELEETAIALILGLMTLHQPLSTSSALWY